MDWKMPDLGEGVQEGEIVKWLVKEGDRVSIDQHLVEIMTDKATMEIPSSIEGVIQKIMKREGSVAKIGETLAEIVGGGEDMRPETRDHGPEEGKREERREEKVENREKKEEGREPKTESRVATGKVLAAPSVRQLARDLNVDLSKIQGSGPGGRVVKQDLETKDKIPASPQVSSPSPQVPSPVPHIPLGPESRQPLRGLRRKIAEHMVLSRKTAAHFTHVDEADLTDLVLAREAAKKEAEAKGIKLTFLSYIIKAVIEGLKKFPQMNASLDEASQEIILKKYYNIGVAAATEEGLIVPVIKNADKLSLWDLAKAISRLGEAARNKKTALEDLKGGTFTVTNIGSIGGILSAPIINYPEVAIMGLHQIKKRPVVKDGVIVVRDIMYISISADHRVVDGAEVAAFLKFVIGILENPGKIST